MATVLSLSPKTGGTISVSATTSSARTAITIVPNGTIRILNVGSVVTFIRLGDVTVVATAADIPILPNGEITIAAVLGTTNVAAITASGTATIYATPCFGG